ncbi:hypothetical protein BKA82DRAFT_152604 [Pisolithus tinctorius]|uniref:Uncharacterized protein n=1 Tax=Pisolithus tinctorius Marx 270 TaxID=870435 RepID=A0A0C3NHP9_PISTI|nr:hypothetical protein BKA82DRAFT_152604 [Pisolithus tinctorius]KIO00545.1 hypothetical protein M404DRAFT_152604 [Pisolithus tinctorius Marx 270]
MNWDHQGSLFYPNSCNHPPGPSGPFSQSNAHKYWCHYSNVIRVYVQHNQTLKKSAFSHPCAVSPTHI